MTFRIKPYSWLLGTILASAQLTAFAGAADAEANLHRLHVPEGFKIEVYAEVPGPRQMALGTNGNVYVGTSGNKVYAVVDKNKDRKADKVVPILDDLKVGTGVAMFDGHLYVGEQHRITRYAAPDASLELPFKEMREVIYDKLPNKAQHGWRYIAFGPDSKLYVTVGAPCNICDVTGIEGTILRMNPDGSQVETFAKGMRNSMGIDFQPGTKVAHFTDNGADTLGDDIPHDEFNAAPTAGLHFGFPYYAGGNAQFPAWKNKTPPQKVTFPVAEFQAHSANLGFKFYTGKQFPSQYQGNAIVTQHGSWNRSSPVGYQLVRVIFDEQNKVKGTEVFIDGWLNDGEAWGRPNDVLQLPDGSLLVSDDFADVIYRISYKEGQSSKAALQTPAPKSPALPTVTGLLHPESSISHPNGRVFVTEIGEFEKKGDGKVTVINPDGSKQTLADGLNGPKGIDLFDDQLYVADVDRVLRIDLSGKVTVIAKPEDFQDTPTFFNDIEIDGLGNVFVSDSGDDNGKHGAIYKITPKGQVTQIINDKSGIKRPNGLLLDGPDALLVADLGTGKLYRLVYTEQGTKAKATLTLLNQGFGAFDGLVRDTSGALYTSDWAGGKVWRLSEPKATPQLVSKGHQSAADISLSNDGKTILMPDMKAGTLVYIPIH